MYDLYNGTRPRLPRIKCREHGNRGAQASKRTGIRREVAACGAAHYNRQVRFMKIRHKGLRALHERDDAGRLTASLVPRLRRILFRLQEASHPRSADAPGFRLHPLKGDRTGEWSVRVSGNWRVVFRFENDEVVDVDLVDYH